jgi:Zn-dependent protease
VGHRITVGSIAGIEVRVHRSWVLIALLVGWSFWNRFVLVGFAPVPSLLMAIVGAALFFLSVLIHEFAHALEAQHRGVEVSGITLFLFGGVTEMSSDIRRPRDEFALTAIGPFSSLVLAAAFGLVAFYGGQVGLEVVAQVAGLLGWINLALGLFNLLPGAPLDGGRILRALVWSVTGDRQRAVRFAARAGQLLAALIVSAGILQLLLLPGAVIGGVWLILIGAFLAVAAQSEIAQHAIGEALRGLTVGEVLRRAGLVTLPADTDLAAAVEQLRVGSETSLAITRDGRIVGVLLLDQVTELAEEQRAGRAVSEVMLPIEELPWVDRGSEVTEALRELAGTQPLAVTSSEGDREQIEGVVAPEQLERVVRRTLELGRQPAPAGPEAGPDPPDHLPQAGR